MRENVMGKNDIMEYLIDKLHSRKRLLLILLSFFSLLLLLLYTVSYHLQGHFKPSWLGYNSVSGNLTKNFSGNINSSYFNVSAGKYMPPWPLVSTDDIKALGERSITVVMYNAPDWHRELLNKSFIEKQCPVPCRFTSNTSDIGTADGVIFFAVGMPKLQRLLTRPVGQVWIYFTLESPYNTYGEDFGVPMWRHQINWTMTYRLDSDIWMPYGKFYQRLKPWNATSLSQMIARKIKLVAWVVSHCKTPSRREDYVWELRKYIPVDIYGSCGPLQCGDRCFDVVSQHYKFYLAFENSLCSDYVTEKAYDYMELADVVVVTRGSANYSRLLPPGSYISTSDFSSPRQLAEYLLFLDRSPEMYSKYFEWRKILTRIRMPFGCEICIRLLRRDLYRKRYENVSRWWNEGQCHKARDLRMHPKLHEG